MNIEDYVDLQVACEYHANTSELVQMLEKGHHNVKLDAEAWDRLFTWIDLNGPCHGTWGEVAPIPKNADRRRRELASVYGGPKDDPERMPEATPAAVEAVLPVPVADARPERPEVAGWPFDALEAERRQRAGGPWEKTVDLGGGVALKMVRIPGGEFVMGSAEGDADERPLSKVKISGDFWMSAHEITNEQFRRFAPRHFSGCFMKRSFSNDGPGIAMDGLKQPAVRLSWQQAAAFCRWLSGRTGGDFDLPSEAQWEYACRAGTASAMGYGDVDDDFSARANVADAALARIYTFTGGVVVLQDFPVDNRFDDGAVATADVGSYSPNAWGLYDMHGNAAEWTRGGLQPYPWREGSSAIGDEDQKVVRGGSFFDRPVRCRSAFRLSYPSWQRVHNVGFRVVQRAGK